MIKILMLVSTLMCCEHALAMDDYRNNVPMDAQGLLEYQLVKPTRVRGSASKITPGRSENFVADEEEKYDWYSRTGRPLTPEQIQATKSMIENSDCKYIDFASKDARPPSGRRIRAPGCRGGAEPIIQCEGRVKCTFPGFPLVVAAICFAEHGRCPDAKTCALQSAFDVKQDRLHGDEVVFRSMWIGGYSVEK